MSQSIGDGPADPVERGRHDASLSQQVWRNSVDRLEAAILLLGSKIKAAEPGGDESRRLDLLRDAIASMLKDIRPIGRQWGYDPHDEVVDGSL
jgi:hypothetical protein